MRTKIAALGFAAALAALSALAEEPAAKANKDDQEKARPDYSKPAMMYILYELEPGETPINAPAPYMLHVPGFGTVGFVLAAAAGNGIGIAGLAPIVKIQPRKVLDAYGSGTVDNGVCRR
jgi:hypothetical protein